VVIALTVLHFGVVPHGALSTSFLVVLVSSGLFFVVDEIFLINVFNCCFFADLRVLNKYHSVQSFSAISNIYDNTGLFGIYLTTVS